MFAGKRILIYIYIYIIYIYIYIYIYNIKDKHIKAHKRTLISNVVLIQILII